MEQERVFCPQTGQERIARPRRINIPTVRAAPLELPGDPQSQLYFLGTWHDHFTFAGPFLISGKNLKTIYNIMYSISDKKKCCWRERYHWGDSLFCYTMSWMLHFCCIDMPLFPITELGLLYERKPPPWQAIHHVYTMRVYRGYTITHENN